MQINDYYGHKREDIAELAVTSGIIKNVLDIGCGYGMWGQFLKSNGAEKVDGIEISTKAYKKAKQNLDKVILGSAEDKTVIDQVDLYDCILCADILEHLIDPWKLLIKHKSILANNGCIIASIPNIAHYKIIKMLILFS